MFNLHKLIHKLLKIIPIIIIYNFHLDTYFKFKSWKKGLLKHYKH